MAQIDSMQLNMNSRTDNANKVKEIVLEQLRKDERITEEQMLEYAEKWQVIIIKAGWFKRWMNVFHKDMSSDDYCFKFVRFED